MLRRTGSSCRSTGSIWSSVRSDLMNSVNSCMAPCTESGDREERRVMSELRRSGYSSGQSLLAIEERTCAWSDSVEEFQKCQQPNSRKESGSFEWGQTGPGIRPGGSAFSPVVRFQVRDHCMLLRSAPQVQVQCRWGHYYVRAIASLLHSIGWRMYTVLWGDCSSVPSPYYCPLCQNERGFALQTEMCVWNKCTATIHGEQGGYITYLRWWCASLKLGEVGRPVLSDILSEDDSS